MSNAQLSMFHAEKTVAAVYNRWNEKARRSQSAATEEIYSMISSMARCPWRAAELASKDRIA